MPASTSPLTARHLAADLRARGFTGQAVDDRHPEYPAARRVWNGAIDRRPLLVARCADHDDVLAVVGVARATGLPLAVRGGGHSIPGHSTCDGGIVLDLSPMQTVRVDPVRRRARVGGGALLGQLDRATQEHGLAVPAGQVSHTGVAGLTLGGGIGWLMRRHGLTIDNLAGAEVVTAAGDVVWTDAEEHPDLFWALRGGGGNFGVVTAFEYALHEVGPLVTGGVMVWPFERAAEILAASRDLMAQAPDELTIFELLLTLPPHAPFPEHLQGRPAVMISVAHVGDEDAARADLAPLRALGPELDIVGPMPYVVLQSMIDDGNRAGQGHSSKAHWMTGLPDDLIDTLVAAQTEATSPGSHLITARMGGAVARVGRDETAFAHRDAERLLWIIGYWDAEDDAAPHRRWVDDAFEAARPHSTGGVYVNGLDDEGPARVRAAYDEGTFARLVAVKDRWDPENLFRLNQNVAPSGGMRG